jgi:hypothetical protein
VREYFRVPDLPAKVQTKANFYSAHEEKAQHTFKPRWQQRINELVEQILPIFATKFLKTHFRCKQKDNNALKRLKLYKTLFLS